MSQTPTKRSTLNTRAREIAAREGIGLDAALKVACAVNPELAEQVRCEQGGRAVVARPDPVIPEATAVKAELFDRAQVVQREQHCSFEVALSAVAEDAARHVRSDTEALALFLNLADKRSRSRGLALGQAMDVLRTETPTLWRRASSVMRGPGARR